MTKLIADFDLEIGRDVMIRVGNSFDERERHAAFRGGLLRRAVQADQELTRRAYASSLPVIPTVPAAVILVA